MNHVRTQFEVWGTVVDVDIASVIIGEIELNIAIENAVLTAPEQFIWAYNRYKHPSGAELPPSN